jgi:hypothetical protein
LPNGIWVSTVWLGLNHAWRGRPLVFETMVFGVEDNECVRYSTIEEARVGHEKMVAKWTVLARLEDSFKALNP